MCRLHGLFCDFICGVRIFQIFKQRHQHFVHHVFHRRAGFRVAEPRFRLPLKLDAAHLQRDHRGEAFAEILPGKRWHLVLQDAGFAAIIVQDLRESSFEARLMRAAFRGGNVVDIRENTLGVSIVVLHRNLNKNVILLSAEVQRFFIERGLIFIQVFHKVRKAAFKLEFGILLLPALPFVRNPEQDASVEVSKLTQTLDDGIIVHFKRLKHFLIRQKRDF